MSWGGGSDGDKGSVRAKLFLADDGPGGPVDTVEELTDILLLDLAGLLDVGHRSTHSLERVAHKADLVLLLGPVDLNTLLHVDAEGDLHDLQRKNEQRTHFFPAVSMHRKTVHHYDEKSPALRGADHCRTAGLAGTVSNCAAPHPSLPPLQPLSRL